MVTRSTCSFIREGGSRCRSAPLRDGEYCFWHSPDHSEEAAEARRLGGQRRKRERVVSGAYEFAGLQNVESIRRLVEVAVIDALGLENSVARVRALAYLAQVATRLLEADELESRVEELERALGPRMQRERGNRR